MKRTALRSRPRDRGTDRDAAHAWFEAVTRRKACVVCRKRSRSMQAHHVIPQGVLRTGFRYGAIWDAGRGQFIALQRVQLEMIRSGTFPDLDVPTRSLQELLWDERNGIPLCPRDHERHTNVVERVPVIALPAAAFVFARELGLQHRLGPRYYEHIA